MFRPGILELLVVLLLVLLLFGGDNKLPRLARSIGEAIREFKREVSGKGRPKEKKDQEK